MKFRHILMVWALVLFTGCSNTQNHAQAAAIDPPDGALCAVDGMIISHYPGPKAQIHYKDKDKIDFLCETKELFQIYAEPGMPARIAHAFVQDSGETGWDTPKGHWIDAIKAYYVVGSSKTGSMGATYASFSDMTKAQAFAKQYSGSLKSFEEILADHRQHS